MQLLVVAQVGGKNASLGTMYRELGSQGVKVPNGFATTAQPFRDFLEEAGLTKRISEALSDPALNKDSAKLARTGAAIRGWIMDAPLPAVLSKQIVEAYKELCASAGGPTDAAVAVRSSATAEDLPTASFAGQQDSYLHICGVEALLRTVRRVMASLYTNRAISYRIDKQFGHDAVALSVGVQLMVRSDVGAAGVAFTLDTESGFDGVVLVTSSYGLGENVVGGSVNPDEWVVYKRGLADGVAQPIIRRRLGEKAVKRVYSARQGDATVDVAVAPAQRRCFSLTDTDVAQIARHSVAIEAYFSAKAGVARPMDVECVVRPAVRGPNPNNGVLGFSWLADRNRISPLRISPRRWAKDGVTGEIFVVQARPETIHRGTNDSCALVTYEVKVDGARVLATGRAVGSKAGSGAARVILEARPPAAPGSLFP